MPTSISSIVCSDNLRLREKSCPGRFTQAGKSAVIERIAWCSVVRTCSGYAFFSILEGLLKNVLIFKAKPSIFNYLSSVFYNFNKFYMSTCMYKKNTTIKSRWLCFSGLNLMTLYLGVAYHFAGTSALLFSGCFATAPFVLIRLNKQV